MKKTALTVILTLTLLFTACGSAERVSVNPASNSEPASSTGVCSSTAPEVFGSVKELLGFFTDQREAPRPGAENQPQVRRP